MKDWDVLLTSTHEDGNGSASWYTQAYATETFCAHGYGFTKWGSKRAALKALKKLIKSYDTPIKYEARTRIRV